MTTFVKEKIVGNGYDSVRAKGRRAFLEGKPRRAPYDPTIRGCAWRARVWEQGWNEAKEDGEIEAGTRKKPECHEECGSMSFVRCESCRDWFCDECIYLGGGKMCRPCAYC